MIFVFGFINLSQGLHFRFFIEIVPVLEVIWMSLLYIDFNIRIESFISAIAKTKIMDTNVKQFESELFVLVNRVLSRYCEISDGHWILNGFWR